MQKITTSIELRESIKILEQRQAFQGKEFRDQFFTVNASSMPINIIRNTFTEVASSPDLITKIIGATLGLTAGYVSNKTFVGSSASLMRKLLGTIMQFGVTTLILKNPDALKSLGQSILHRLLNKKATDS